MHRFALSALVLVFATSAFAYDEPPFQSYTRVSPNKAFVFVMLITPPPGRNPDDLAPVDPIAAKYKQSGLYKNDGSTTPLWVYSDGYTRDVYPASDGIHFVTQHLHVI